MTDLEFITGLMQHNTDALGFIPTPTIANRFLPRGQVILQRDRFAKRIGYLIHGPVHPDGTVNVHQTCIELDRRNRHFATQAVQTLLTRAKQRNARLISLRCATDLAAIAFWLAMGFNPTALCPGGARRQRVLTRFELHLPGSHVLPAPKSGLRLASSEPAPTGLSAALKIYKRRTAG